MLDTDTKRRIDTARDILVGKVPDPKSQVEQITIALIYKFMDDMDAESEEMGGKRKFFAGDFAKYGWVKLIRSGLGGYETLNLYAEAIAKMPENPGIPMLFRDIFKNAYLPYRDPETLRAFLKIIDEFDYDHSERLGDAFEYLLSVLGSQGDAGQFRTPRHIIDFMVEIIAPKKNESVLDPACGTAGFLISSYKHIVKANLDEKGNSKLTPDEKARLAQNFRGYDISPDMVRLSLVNMYLHGFTAPQIFEYDTLTSMDRWNEYADVIMANPPFMSPTGGIRPHNRFSVQSKRSEVLFVDYMAEHLTPNGRAAIIVPEGIIFQSQKAYVDLRRMLLENSLVAVVSLPAGVFNPYSQVKTSILILDKSIAKKAKTIGFFKIENDGFGLGAQRKPIEKNDLPLASDEIREYLRMVGAGEDVEGWESKLGLIVWKVRVEDNGDFNLSGERYRIEKIDKSTWPLLQLKKITIIESGSRQKGGAIVSGIPSIGGEQIDNLGRIRIEKMRYISEDHFNNMTKGVLKKGDVLIVKDGATTGKVGYFNHDFKAAVNEHVFILRAKESIYSNYLFYVLRSQAFQEKLQPIIKGIIGGISLEFGNLKVPVPNIEIQQEIIEEIEEYQRIVDGARAVVENYRPRIQVDPEWPLHNLGEIAENLDNQRIPISKEKREHGIYPYYGASGIVDYVNDYIFDEDILLISEDGANLLARVTPIAFSVAGKCWVNNHAHVLKFKNIDNQKYVEYYLNSISIKNYITGTAQPKLNKQALNSIKVPMPVDNHILSRIVSDIDEELSYIEGNKRLINRYTDKINETISRIWND